MGAAGRESKPNGGDAMFHENGKDVFDEPGNAEGYEAQADGERGFFVGDGEE